MRDTGALVIAASVNTYLGAWSAHNLLSWMLTVAVCLLLLALDTRSGPTRGELAADLNTPSEKAPKLGGTSWQLVKFETSDGTTVTPDDRSRYTIEFDHNGHVSARIDCNRGSSTWKSDGPNQLRFGPLAITFMLCPQPSLHDRIVKDWTEIRSYAIRDGHLFLLLMANGGSYEFEPAGSSQSSLFGRKWRLTKLRDVAVNKTKPFIEFNGEAMRFSGDAGCNRFSGSFELNGMQIKFGPAMSTKRACLDREIQQVESDFLKALEEVSEYQIQVDVLRLNAGGRTVLTFRADSAPDSAEPARVTGTITYTQRIAITPGTIVRVKLLDLSRAGAPVESILELPIKPGGQQVPIAFELPYDPRNINQRHRYVIQAQILKGRRLLFASTDAYPVLTAGHPNSVNVIVKPVRM